MAAQGELDDIASDTIITPSEKLTAYQLWYAIVGEQAGVLAQGTAWLIYYFF